MSQITTGDSGLVKEIKDRLSHAGVFSKVPKIHKQDGAYCIYSSADPTTLESLLRPLPSVLISPYTQNTHNATARTLGEMIESFLKTHNVHIDPGMAASLPRKWSLYPPMVLFNASTFDHPHWEPVFAGHVGSLLCQEMLSFPEFRRYTHLAVNKPIIEDDVMRRPFNIHPLFGDFGPKPTEALYTAPSEEDLGNAFFCHVTQNGIHQAWAPMYTMFSRGNIKEKKRLLDQYTSLHGTTAVDLYAGIGYFSLSYLKNGAQVFAWEINAWSIEGLRRGLTENGFKFKVFGRQDDFSPEIYDELRQSGIQAYIFHESNEYASTRLKPIMGELAVSHVNLGLLPSSRPSWGIVQEILSGNRSPTTVHVHENVHISEFDGLKKCVETEFKGHVLHLEKVKTFAPDIWHVVVDVEVNS